MVGTRFAFCPMQVARRSGVRRWMPVALGLMTAMCMATITKAQTTSDSTTYSFPDRGGATVVTIGGTSGIASTVAVAYARVEPGGGTTAPSAFAVLDYRPANTLLTETAIPATLPILSGRMYVEASGSVKTGIALTNTNDTVVTISFFFTDQNGNNLATNSFTLGAREQIARFSDEFPFNMSGSFTGTLTFSTTAP